MFNRALPGLAWVMEESYSAWPPGKVQPSLSVPAMGKLMSDILTSTVLPGCTVTASHAVRCRTDKAVGRERSNEQGEVSLALGLYSKGVSQSECLSRIRSHLSIGS